MQENHLGKRRYFDLLKTLKNSTFRDKKKRNGKCRCCIGRRKAITIYSEFLCEQYRDCGLEVGWLVSSKCWHRTRVHNDSMVLLLVHGWSSKGGEIKNI